MCVTLCHVKKQLYFNHIDCNPWYCEFAGNPRGRCADCRYRQGALCGLTRLPLPEAGGCCHWNVELTGGALKVTRSMIEMLEPGANEAITDVLDGYDVPYRENEGGDVRVESGELGLPDVYGLGTDE